MHRRNRSPFRNRVTRKIFCRHRSSFLVRPLANKFNYSQQINQWETRIWERYHHKELKKYITHGKKWSLYEHFSHKLNNSASIFFMIIAIAEVKQILSNLYQKLQSQLTIAASCELIFWNFLSLLRCTFTLQMKFTFRINLHILVFYQSMRRLVPDIYKMQTRSNNNYYCAFHTFTAMPHYSNMSDLTHCPLFLVPIFSKLLKLFLIYRLPSH